MPSPKPEPWMLEAASEIWNRLNNADPLNWPSAEDCAAIIAREFAASGYGELVEALADNGEHCAMVEYVRGNAAMWGRKDHPKTAKELEAWAKEIESAFARIEAGK